ncbi:MAG: tyrosine-type recombinase/integrase [Saccharofermentanales bacterium]
MKNEYQFKSNFAEYIKAFLNEIHMVGFKYEKQGRWLERFDDHCYVNGYIGTHLNKDLVEEFCYGTSYEKASTHYVKERIMCSFAEFLQKQGVDAFICLKLSAPSKRSSYVPYIFSKEELKNIFTEIDNYPHCSNSNRGLTDALLFRLLYGSGLRLSEALDLKCENVDLEAGTITILHSKNNKDRMIPIATSLIERCKTFENTVHTLSNADTYYFKSSWSGARIDNSTIYRRFRDYLWMAGISHCGKGPRIHDYRHTYCVHRLKKWVMAGNELTNLMPYLSTYLGHSDFRGTQYYLRLTADLYPDIIKRSEAAFEYLIPERRIGHEEE